MFKRLATNKWEQCHMGSVKLAPSSWLSEQLVNEVQRLIQKIW